MEKVPFTPLFARALLKRTRTEKIGSILLPESAKGKLDPDEGTLVAIGHTCEPEVKELLGKKVMFAKYSGAWIKINEEEYFICQEEDLLGVKYE